MGKQTSQLNSIEGVSQLLFEGKNIFASLLPSHPSFPSFLPFPENKFFFLRFIFERTPQSLLSSFPQTSFPSSH
uniref:Uncharacterized protein n=1 Tax=Meloidogyne enterolobii TaxID=390850 RepID=A0A6V7VN30_MELEN|nr:unnamed protein product [Meloidogyne enterolobii]